MRAARVVLACALCAPLMVLGCGDDSDNGGGSGGSTGGSGGTAGTGGTGGTGNAGGGGGEEVPATTLIGLLSPYNPGGADLFPPGSVEAHWYQFGGVYVVLYRGYDATSPDVLCPGNSIQLGDGSFVNISNSPLPSGATDACTGAPNVVPDAVRTCGTLLYYITEIPVSTDGNLYGTLELSTDMGFIGQTTAGGTPTSSGTAPEFTPDLTSYTLPASDVDPAGTVNCP